MKNLLFRLVLVSAFLIFNSSLFAQITITENHINCACFGDSNGAISINVTGGNPPYSYSWTGPNGFNSNVVNIYNLQAGDYQINVFDQNNDSESLNISITQPSELDVQENLSSHIDVTCYGGTEGVLEVFGTGGVAPYQHTLNSVDWQNSGQFSNLASGWYAITIMDGNGCTDTTNISIQGSGYFNLYLDTFDVSCPGYNDGHITGIPYGGTPPFSYEWSNGVTDTSAIYNLEPGFYNVTVTDANGCIYVNNYGTTIEEPDSMEAELVDVVGVLCTDECIGTATVQITGNSYWHTYLWDDPLNTDSASVSGLCEGTYTVTITNYNGCTIEKSFDVVSVPELFIDSILVTDATCGLSDGTATAYISGGTSSYSYNWENSSSTLIGNNLIITDLTPGNYYFKAIDDMTCMATQSINIQVENPLIISFDEINEPTCQGYCDGNIDISVVGGNSIYSYQWHTNSGNQYNTQDIDNLCQDLYIVVVTDANGCEEIDSLYIQTSDSLSASIQASNPKCFGYCDGELHLNAYGGIPPYEYYWNSPVNMNTQTATNLCDGFYTFTITDGNGCNVTGGTTISEPPFTYLEVDTIYDASNGLCNGNVNYSIIGNFVSPIEIEWSNGNTNFPSNNLCPGLYSFTITDFHACEASLNFEIGDSGNNSITYVDTLIAEMDTCIFDSNFPIDSAFIYDYNIVGTDSVELFWEFWQDGSPVYLDFVLPIDMIGNNLVFLNVLCNSKSETSYQFYGSFDTQTVGKQKIEVFSNVKLYPNPVKDKINIESPDEIESIQVFAISGQLVMQVEGNSTKESIDVSNLERGSYFVKAQINESVSIIKFIKE